MSQLIRHRSLGVQCATKAKPAPNPFPGGRLPTAMCRGWSVNNVSAQPPSDLKLKESQLDFRLSPSSLKSPPRSSAWRQAAHKRLAIARRALIGPRSGTHGDEESPSFS